MIYRMVIKMKSVTMFLQASCPFCIKALKWMDELVEEYPEYKNIEVIKIDEIRQPEIADAYDYYFVPTYYIEDEKVHEGIASKEIVKKVFDLAKE